MYLRQGHDAHCDITTSCQVLVLGLVDMKLLRDFARL